MESEIEELLILEKKVKNIKKRIRERKKSKTITINGTKAPVLMTFRRYSAIRPVTATVASSLAIRLRFMSFFMIYSLCKCVIWTAALAHNSTP